MTKVNGSFLYLFFIKLITKFKILPEIDFFASQINKQLEKHVSCSPDPQSLAVDGFDLSWGQLNFHAFPPLSLIDRSSSKIFKEKTSEVIVIPW